MNASEASAKEIMKGHFAACNTSLWSLDGANTFIACDQHHWCEHCMYASKIARFRVADKSFDMRCELLQVANGIYFHMHFCHHEWGKHPFSKKQTAETLEVIFWYASQAFEWLLMLVFFKSNHACRSGRSQTLSRCPTISLFFDIPWHDSIIFETVRYHLISFYIKWQCLVFFDAEPFHASYLCCCFIRWRDVAKPFHNNMPQLLDGLLKPDFSHRSRA